MRERAKLYKVPKDRKKHALGKRLYEERAEGGAAIADKNFSDKRAKDNTGKMMIVDASGSQRHVAK